MGLFFMQEEFGFSYGPMKVRRLFSDAKKGWVTLGVGKVSEHGHPDELQIYFTKSGKVRIFDRHGEWTKPKRNRK